MREGKKLDAKFLNLTCCPLGAKRTLHAYSESSNNCVFANKTNKRNC